MDLAELTAPGIAAGDLLAARGESIAVVDGATEVRTLYVEGLRPLAFPEQVDSPHGYVGQCRPSIPNLFQDNTELGRRTFLGQGCQRRHARPRRTFARVPDIEQRVDKGGHTRREWKDGASGGCTHCRLGYEISPIGIERL